MNTICEICNISDISKCSDYKLSISNEYINDSYIISQNTIQDFNTMSVMADAISSRRANGYIYLRLIYLWQNEYQNISEKKSVKTSIDICKKANKEKNESKRKETILHLKKNYIKYFNFHSIPNEIVHLNLSRNILDKCLYFPQHLLSISISHNKIKELPKLPKYLEKLGASDCGLIKLPELPVTLKKLSIHNNDITILPDSFIHCIHLEKLNYENNTNLHVSKEQLQFIEDIFERIRIREREEEERRVTLDDIRYYRENVRNKSKTLTIYNFSQNVHNNKIHSDVEKSIETLMKTCNMRISDYSFMSKQWKHIIRKFIKRLHKVNIKDDFIEDMKEMIRIHPNKHSQIQLSFSDLFILWISKVEQFNDDTFKEIVNILISDIVEMKTVCLTGKIGRLINSLSGFTNIVQIGITIHQQLLAKQHQYNKKIENIKYLNENDKYVIILHWIYNDYYIENEINYSVKDKNCINEWLKSLYELLDLDTIDLRKIDEYYRDNKINNILSLEELFKKLGEIF